MPAQRLALLVGGERQPVRPHRVLRRIAAAELHAGVLGAEIGRVVAAPAAAAGRDEDVARQRIVVAGERLGHDRADLRIVGRRRLPAAGEHQVGALAVIVFLGVHAADDGQVVHLLGRLRQQLADVHARHRRGNRAKRPAGFGAGLGVPAFELAQAAVHVEDDDPLLLLGKLLGRERTSKPAQGRPRPRPRRLPDCPGIVAGPTGVRCDPQAYEHFMADSFGE